MAQSAACTGNGKISKQIAKQMSAAQDAMKAKKWQESLNKLKEAESQPGAKSQFDVLADGAIVFSKQSKGRFPEDGEIVGLLKTQL